MSKEKLFIKMLGFFKTAHEETGGDLASIIEWFQEEIDKIGKKKLKKFIKNKKWPTIDDKIKELQSITNNFIYIEYYSHSQQNEYKINNEFTKYQKDIAVLCPVSDGIEKALDLAIKHISKCKTEFNQVIK